MYFHLLKRAPQFFDCVVQHINGPNMEVIPASITIARMERALEYMDNVFALKNPRNARLLSYLKAECDASNMLLDDIIYSALTLFIYGNQSPKFGNARTEELLKEVGGLCGSSSSPEIINSALMLYIQIIKSIGSALKADTPNEISRILSLVPVNTQSP